MFHNSNLIYESRALELLRKGSGDPDAVFRDGQLEAILELLSGSRRLLLVQKTGWGKSFVYFIATKLLREEGRGPALLVSPLLSLMRNQIDAANRMGVRAARVASDNTEEWEEVESKIQSNLLDILLIHPKRLNNQNFLEDILSLLSSNVSTLIIDEAHCISDWGHDFIPEYRLIQRLSHNLPKGYHLLATTATANNRVMDDLCEVLGPSLEVFRGELSRPSLFLQTIRYDHMYERLAWLADYVPKLEGTGIIYCLTVRDANLVCDWLKTRKIIAEAYTGKSDNKERESMEQKLLNNELKVLVATTALGMGYDKPDLAFVIHYQTPGSVVYYYQQVGRAGRALDNAYGILLSGEEENDINNYFINSAFPSRDEVEKIILALSDAKLGLSKPQLYSKLNIRSDRINKALELLSFESPAPIIKEGSKWMISASELKASFWERAKRLTELRKQEWAQMKKYVGLKSGHMEFLIKALDGDPKGYKCPDLTPISNELRPDTVKAAIDFMKRFNIKIPPRRMWQQRVSLPIYQFKGKIHVENQVEEGRALSVYGDSGWGNLVSKGKSDGYFSDDLLNAFVDMIYDWSPNPRPAWLTYVPSSRRKELVANFAMRVAARLEVPCVSSLRIVREYPPQKTMQNSAQQLKNLDGAFEVLSDSILRGPCYLIDDIFDSRWTFTVTGYLLKKSGAAEVFPLTLASSAPSK